VQKSDFYVFEIAFLDLCHFPKSYPQFVVYQPDNLGLLRLAERLPEADPFLPSLYSWFVQIRTCKKKTGNKLLQQLFSPYKYSIKQ